MRALSLFVVSVFALAMGGCATAVDDGVPQIADPPPAQDPPAQTLSGQLPQRVQDSAYRALVDDALASGVPPLPPHTVLQFVPSPK